ncbi:MAG: hypothetical protein V4486_02225 [Patescibacteria group bacterium]
MRSGVSKLEQHITAFLSHRPKLYAFVVGVGVVLFWRGIWHTADQIHSCFFIGYAGCSTTDAFTSPWWDGPASFVIGVFILYFTGAFISSFIGNELILSGLRGEKRLSQKTEGEVENEVSAISEIQEALEGIEGKIKELENKLKAH